MTPKGVLTTVYGFANTSAQGRGPLGLIEGPNGSLYGTTVSGGTGNNGTIFQLTSTGTLTVLHSFCSQANCTDGTTPQTGLVLGTDGNFYGTTLSTAVRMDRARFSKSL